MTSTDGSFGGRVYAAVAAGWSVERVRRVIDECAPPGDERRRAEAVNKIWGDFDDWEHSKYCSFESPMQAAYNLERGDLVGLLLKEGADVDVICDDTGYELTALAVCVRYDLPETIHALLRKGHDANQPLQTWSYPPEKKRVEVDTGFLPRAYVPYPGFTV